MHEMSLAESVLGIIEDQARVQGYQRVRRVVLEIGQLSNVEADSLRFCFASVVRDSLADGATLDIVATPGAAWCLPCARSVALTQRYDPCPHCGGFELEVTGGTALRVLELEVD